MDRLGPSHSTPSEWGAATGHYDRLTIGSDSKLRRPIEGYPVWSSRTGNSPSSSPPYRIFRTECLDIGFVETQFCLGNKSETSNHLKSSFLVEID